MPTAPAWSAGTPSAPAPRAATPTTAPNASTPPPQPAMRGSNATTPSSPPPAPTAPTSPSISGPASSPPARPATPPSNAPCAPAFPAPHLDERRARSAYTTTGVPDPRVARRSLGPDAKPARDARRREECRWIPPLVDQGVSWSGRTPTRPPRPTPPLTRTTRQAVGSPPPSEKIHPPTDGIPGRARPALPPHPTP